MTIAAGRHGIDQRSAPRTPVFHRTRGTISDGSPIALTLVDLSANGFMARCEHDLPAEATLHLRLPVIGLRSAQVRWSLGGRIGCHLDQPIRPIDMAAMLGTIGAPR